MSSVNYDPQKAHEYYEQHKKLKGKRSTKGFSQSQKEQWDYAKAQINGGYKQASTDITEYGKSARKQLSEAAKQKIEAIRAKMKGMSKEQKASLKEQIQGIRDALKSDRDKLTEDTKGLRTNAKAEKEKAMDAAFNSIKGK